MKVEGSKTTITDWLLDVIDAFHDWREGFFQQKQRPRLFFMSERKRT
jgi:hypothetical protein